MADYRELLARLHPDLDVCPFCRRDPYHYVDVGVGYQAAAVNCCDLGISLIQHGDEQLAKEIALRTEAAAAIEALQREVLAAEVRGLERAAQTADDWFYDPQNDCVTDHRLGDEIRALITPEMRKSLE